MNTRPDTPPSSPLPSADPALRASPLNPLDLALADFLHTSEPGTDPRHAWLAALTSHQYGRGHSCLDLELLARRGAATLGWTPALPPAPGWALPDDLPDAAASLPWIRGAHSPLVLDGPRLYLRRNWQAEQNILAQLRARLGLVDPGLANRAALLDPLFPAPPSPGPDWQKLACALALRSRLCLITGGPGTGKTTTVVRLLALLHAAARGAHAPLRLALAAPTGKAAARLGDAIAGALQQLPAALRFAPPAAAMTLHKLLHRPEDLAALDLLVVDEASMIDLDLMDRLLTALPLSARLVLLGDKDQLASVEAGAVLAQLCEGAAQGGYTVATAQALQADCGADLSAWTVAPTVQASPLAQHTVMLRHSRRFAAQGGIGQWASRVHAGDSAGLRQLLDATPLWHPGGTAGVSRLAPATPDDPTLMALLRQGWQPFLEALQAQMALLASGAEAPLLQAQALRVLQALARFQVLCAVRSGPFGVDSLNRRIASALGPQAGAGGDWYAGRPVMVQRNDHALGLMNGDVGVCLPMPQGLRVAFADGPDALRWVLPARLAAVDSVFAMTVHKAQGSEFEQVCLVLPPHKLPLLTRELLYTGITRARTGLCLVLPDTGTGSASATLGATVREQVLRSGGLHAIHQGTAAPPPSRQAP